MAEPRTFICTVHMGTEPWWAVVQPRFIRKHLPNATIVAAIDESMEGKPDFDNIEVMEGLHKDKLNALALLVINRLSVDGGDRLIFFDSDSFPIRDASPFVEETLGTVPLAAVCRQELSDDFPHPSFCVTTTGFWKEIGGTWDLSTAAPANTVNDLGCRLRDILRERGIDWRRLLRSNQFNPHPVMFGLYNGLIYHHGAGSRRSVTISDRKLWRGRAPEGTWTSPDKYRFFYDVIASQNGVLSDLMKRLIGQVPDFYEILESPAYD